MKKAVLLLTLFLTVSFALSAQTLKRSVVGSGGFINANSEGRIKSAGMFGQPVTGAYKLNKGGLGNVTFGFWRAPEVPNSIEEELAAGKGIFNYPNPVSSATTFQFNLNEPSLVTINIYNSIGALVATVINNEMRSNGLQSINWDVNGMLASAGAYSYEMIATPVMAGNKAVRYRNFLIIAE